MVKSKSSKVESQFWVKTSHLYVRPIGIVLRRDFSANCKYWQCVFTIFLAGSYNAFYILNQMCDSGLKSS